MSFCDSCGDELHPERAEKYSYCTKPECREGNAKGLRMVAVGVNKAADLYVVLDERTEQDLASGQYKKEPEVPTALPIPSRGAQVRRREAGRVTARSSSVRPARPRWSEAQERLALVYRAMGKKPDEIAKKLGVSPHLVTKILLAATSQGSR